MSPAAEPAVRTPYPGLRSFERIESDLFFGRENTVNDMINRLRPNRFLAVLGTSGSGKSSLVKIGLLDGLELGLLSEAGSRWRIALFRPGANPLRSLAHSLAGLDGSPRDIDLLEAFLARGPRSVVEWCSDGHLPKGANLLLLVDQFEELFRYQGYSERQKAEAFVALLIESARQREVPIYVVITMRSEYLGACALIEGLAEIINDGQFLTPRLNREQCREAIVGPAAVCEASIDEDLVNRLLNDIEDFAPWDDRDSGDQLDRLVRRADQLPLLQHTLNRLWLRARAMRADPGRKIVLHLADYEAIGGLRGAINAHADEVLASLTPGEQKRAEQVFRALTDGKSIATAVRRPTSLAELVAICDGDETGTRAVIQAFAAPGVNFLSFDTPALGPDTIVDISHESLIRQWRKLSGWLIDEGREAQEWTRLGEAATRHRAGEGSLFHGQDLHVWHEHPRPTAAWAARYDQPYAETLAFLDQSLAADRRGKWVRNAIVAAAFIVVVGFGGFGGLIWYLIGLNNDLTTQTALAKKANDDLADKNEELNAAQAALTASLDDLQAAQQLLRDSYLASFDSDVAAAQRDGQWAEAGAMLGSLLGATASGSGQARAYNPAALSAYRMRLAAQQAFPVWGSAVSESVVVVSRSFALPESPSRYVLSLDTRADGVDVMKLVDALTGLTTAEAPIADDQYPEEVWLISADGRDVVFLAGSGNVLRWVTADDTIVDYGPLGETASAVRSVALDPLAGALAVVMFDEDSALVVMRSDSQDVAFRSPIASLVEFDDEELAAATMNGTGVWFLDGSPVVGFQPDGGATRYAVVDAELEEATLLPPTVESVMPSPDGSLLFVVERQPDAPVDGEYLVAADGYLADTGGYAADPAATTSVYTLGVLDEADADIDVLGNLRPDDHARYPMSLVAVLPLASESSGGYRVVIDDGSGDDPRSASLVVDLAAETGPLAAVTAATAAAHGAPLVAVSGGYQVAAAPVEPWGNLPGDATTVRIAWFDPVLEQSLRVADLKVATGAAWPALSLDATAAAWPADKLGPLSGVTAATATSSLLVVSGRYAGILTTGADSADLLLREMTVGRECRFAAGEQVNPIRLVPWTDKTPLFFGIDASGRVLRFEAVWGGSRSAGPAISGPGVMLSCIGHVRPGLGIVLADPARGRVLLQTDAQIFADLPLTVESEKEFNEAATLSPGAPTVLAALSPSDPPTLAAFDTTGRLTVMRSDPGWRTVTRLRTSVVPSPIALSVSGDRALVVGEWGEAVVVDLSTDDLWPVAAGRVPYSPFGYRLMPDGRTVESLVAGSIWRTELPALPPAATLALIAEASAGPSTSESDRDIALQLLRGDDAAAPESGQMALGADAVCYLAANGVIEAWKAEAGQGTPGARLTAAREEADAACTGDSALAAVGRRLAATPHYISPALDPWPVEWSALLHDALAGNRLAARAILVGLSNSADPFAAAAGEWLANSESTSGLEIPDDLLSSAAVGGDIDPALRRVAEEEAESYEPALHELLGHIAAQSGDPERLRQAWVHFRIAELLYRHQIGRAVEADRTVDLRARISRSLSPEALTRSWAEAATWTADVAALPVGTPPPADQSQIERMHADAEALAAGSGSAESPYHLLQAYLWLNLVELETVQKPADAPASYARLAETLTSLPPVSELPPGLVAALSDVSLSLAERAVEASTTMPAGATALTPFFLGVAEPDTGAPSWDAESLSVYAETIDAVTALLAVDPGAVPPDILQHLRFAERRFDHSFRFDDDSTRAAGTAALAARERLLDLLIGLDPARWDWLAARGTTRFWIGYRVHDGDREARFAALSDAIRDLSAAKALAGAGFPPESTYWLTEARRWLPLRDDDKPLYLSLVSDGRADYADLRTALDDGTWTPPLERSELLASNAELLAKVADYNAGIIFDLSDRWSPDDPAMQASVLDTLSMIAEWDRIRLLAIAAGSTWSSTDPGYANAPAYLVGSVGGRLGLDLADATPADECDLVASFPGDPLRRARATAFAEIDIDAAVATCRALWEEDEEDPRLSFLLGRLLWSGEERNGLALDVLKIAADGEYGAAFNTLAGYLETPGIDVPDAAAIHLRLRFGFAQRAILDAYDRLHAWLEPLATTAEHAAGLRWLSERAAALGLPEAHVDLARLSDTSPEDRAYHLIVAALIYEENGDEAQYEEILADIDEDYYVDASDRAEDEWQPEAKITLPPDLIEALKSATN